MADTITTVEALRTIYREPSQRARDKQIDRLDDNCAAFIAHSPFLVLATADAAGRCDVSPKGGPPGFVKVLDGKRLAIPDLAGNNRLDSMQNLVSSAGIGLLFFVPGVDETLRVNGTATITTDHAVIEGFDVAARVAIVVEVAEAFVHCAKALKRSELWTARPDVGDLPTIACMLRDHARLEASVEEVEASLDHSYATTLWRPGGDR